MRARFARLVYYPVMLHGHRRTEMKSKVLDDWYLILRDVARDGTKVPAAQRAHNGIGVRETCGATKMQY
jgi:hypothetical protein